MTEDEMVGWPHRLEGCMSNLQEMDREDWHAAVSKIGSQRVRHNLLTKK